MQRRHYPHSDFAMLARYASHPPISEGRIDRFDKEAGTVTWHYDPHEDDGLEEGEKRGAAVRDGYRLRVHRTPPHPHPGREVPPDPVLRVLLQPDAFAPAPPEDVLGAGVLGSPAVPPLGEQADVGLRLYAPALRMRG